MYQVSNDFKVEEFSEAFLSLLQDLNKIVIACGSKMEGGLFFQKKDGLSEADLNIPIEGNPRKRYNLLNACRGKQHIIEIGLNAGHSAGFILTYNPDIRLTSIDIGRHGYTQACADYLMERFGTRFRFIKGDSTRVIPLIYTDIFDADLIHIDGGHGIEIFRIDLTHAIFMPNTSGQLRHIIIDDTHHPPIREEIIKFINKGFVQSENYGNHWHGHGNLLLRVNKE